MLQVIRKKGDDSVDVVYDYLQEVLERFPILHAIPSQIAIKYGNKRFVVVQRQEGMYSASPNIVRQGLLFTGKVFPDKKMGDVLEYKVEKEEDEHEPYSELFKVLEQHPLSRLLSKGVEMPFGHFGMGQSEGIAMGYKYDTPLIPLTSDLDVARVWATCKYEKGKRKYTPVEDGLGVIYAYQINGALRRQRGLSVVGSFPYCDLDGQKLFSLKLPKGMDLSQHPLVRGFVFTQCREKGEEALAKVGKTILPRDEFSRIGEAFDTSGNTSPRMVMQCPSEELIEKWRKWCDHLLFISKYNDEWVKILKDVPQRKEYEDYFNE